MKNSKLWWWAMVDSVGILVYVSVVAIIMSNGDRLFSQEGSLTGPVVFLLLFLISAVVTGSLFLGRPIYLFFTGLKREAVNLLFYTLATLAAFALIISLVTALKL